MSIPAGRICRKCNQLATLEVKSPVRPYLTLYEVCHKCAVTGLASSEFARVGRWGGVTPVVFLPDAERLPAICPWCEHVIDNCRVVPCAKHAAEHPGGAAQTEERAK